MESDAMPMLSETEPDWKLRYETMKVIADKRLDEIERLAEERDRLRLYLGRQAK